MVVTAYQHEVFFSAGNSTRTLVWKSAKEMKTKYTVNSSEPFYKRNLNMLRIGNCDVLSVCFIILLSFCVLLSNIFLSKRITRKKKPYIKRCTCSVLDRKIN